MSSASSPFLAFDGANPLIDLYASAASRNGFIANESNMILIRQESACCRIRYNTFLTTGFCPHCPAWRVSQRCCALQTFRGLRMPRTR